MPEKAIFCGLEPFLGGFRESMRLQWVIIHDGARPSQTSATSAESQKSLGSLGLESLGGHFEQF